MRYTRCHDVSLFTDVEIFFTPSSSFQEMSFIERYATFSSNVCEERVLKEG